jgi:uncharacterized protein YcbK (DUF882 family)
VGRIWQGRAAAAKGRLRPRLLGLGAALAVLLTTSPAQWDARAAGDTRSLSFFHTHTSESATITYRRDGVYDPAALKQLNWLLRDWRVGEPANMDPRLFDILWEVYRESGSREPINVISAYRSPATNGMLRRASSGVAEHSQHMLGKAMDIRLPDVDTARLREVAMRLQYGGVGFYPSSRFVHVDTGSVRAWPRMSQDQLARLFPNGKTLHLPSNGNPLPGYEEAKAEILQRNAALASQAASRSSGGSIATAIASLFGSKTEQSAPAAPALPSQVSAYAPVLAAVVPTQAPSPEPSPGPVRTASAVPLPPRRPIEVASAAGDVPIPMALQEAIPVDEPEAPGSMRALFAHTALLPSPRQEPRIVLAQVRVSPTLPSEAAIDLKPFALATGFSPRPAGLLETARFTGPAVGPAGVVDTSDAAF